MESQSPLLMNLYILLTDWRYYAILALLYVIQYYVKVFTSGLPPGPLPLPIVGNLHQFDSFIQYGLTEMGKKYGGVFTVYLGPRPVVILHGIDGIKGALVRHSEAFSGRGRWDAGVAAKQNHGIVDVEGAFFRQTKKFVMEYFRKIGSGDCQMEKTIQWEASKVVSQLMQNPGSPKQILDLFKSATANIMLFFIYGKRFDYEDDQLVNMIEKVDGMMMSFNKSFLVNFFTTLRFLPFDPLHYHAGVKGIKGLMSSVKLEYDKCKENEDQYPDSLLKDFRRLQQVNSADPNSIYTDMHISCIGTDLIAGGTDTVSNGLVWACLYLSEYQDVQEKVHQEIISTFGSKMVSWNDRPKLPYTEACLWETMRVSTIAPLPVLHRTWDTATLCGVHVPARTEVMLNIYSAHYDPVYWPDPHVLDPTRFLGEDGKLKKVTSFVPFSLGARMCTGEKLAKMELFLLFVSLFQHFKVSFPSGQRPESFLAKEPSLVLTSPCVNYNFEPRNI